MSHHDLPILVTGGTGKTGRRVADRLGAAGHAVRVGSRSGDPPFDWHDPTTWPAALDGVAIGVRRVRPGSRVPRRRRGGRRRSPTCRRRAASRRLVLLSGRGEAGAHARPSSSCSASGAEWTIVRCRFFAQNFSEGAFVDAVLERRDRRAGRRRRRAVHRRRRHRRRRRRRADRRPPHRCSCTR